LQNIIKCNKPMLNFRKHSKTNWLFGVFGILCLLVFAVSCDRPATSQKQQLQKAVHSMFEDGWNRGDIASFDETIADSVLFHYADSPKTLSRGQMSEFIVRWREAFPDLRMDVEELLVEDNLAAARLTLTGTHEGPWADAEPTGEKVSMALMMFFRFEDGKMVELWEVDDQFGFRRQLGL
jgi:steroid delta-isomerase-like uncharacterized protein